MGSLQLGQAKQFAEPPQKQRHALVLARCNGDTPRSPLSLAIIPVCPAKENSPNGTADSKKKIKTTYPPSRGGAAPPLGVETADGIWTGRCRAGRYIPIDRRPLKDGDETNASVPPAAIREHVQVYPNTCRMILSPPSSLTLLGLASPPSCPKQSARNPAHRQLLTLVLTP
jgi:hypothetical protein